MMVATLKVVLQAKPAHARYRVVPIGQLYHVVDPDGMRVGDPYTSEVGARAKAAQANAKADRAAKRQTRACMTCRNPFESEGLHNRMCGKCRLGSAGEQPAGIMVVKRRAHS